MLYKEKISKLLFSIIILLPLIYFINLLIVHSGTKFNSADFILCIISIPCCILYYKMTQDSNLFLYILIYISIFMNNTSSWIISSNLEDINYFHDSLFLFRLSIVLLILFPNNKISLYIKKHKKNSILLTFLICFILIIPNFFINEYFNSLSLTSMHLIIFILTLKFFNTSIIICLLVKSVREKNFIESVYATSLIILALRTIIFIQKGTYNKYIHLQYSNILFFIAFFVILAGLYIEISYFLLKNNELNTQVENITNHMKEIEEVDKLRSQFFANLSHEFKTPINTIFSCIQMLNSKKEKSDDEFVQSYKIYAETIKKNCYRMIRLTNNLVDITKFNSGFINKNFHNYNIVELVEDISMSVIPYLESKNINLIFDTLVEEAVIKCDSDYIERIILNILSNSIKFSKENGNILIFMDSDSRFVTIKISDDGIGIEKDKLCSVFQPFIQGDKSLTRKKEGSGIGLSLVKSLVQLHNGIVYFNPHVESGSEIIIKLPNVQLNEPDESVNNYASTKETIVSKINIEFSDIYD